MVKSHAASRSVRSLHIGGAKGRPVLRVHEIDPRNENPGRAFIGSEPQLHGRVAQRDVEFMGFELAMAVVGSGEGVPSSAGLRIRDAAPGAATSSPPPSRIPAHPRAGEILFSMDRRSDVRSPRKVSASATRCQGQLDSRTTARHVARPTCFTHYSGWVEVFASLGLASAASTI